MVQMLTAVDAERTRGKPTVPNPSPFVRASTTVRARPGECFYDRCGWDCGGRDQLATPAHQHSSAANWNGTGGHAALVRPAVRPSVRDADLYGDRWKTVVQPDSASRLIGDETAPPTRAGLPSTSHWNNCWSRTELRLTSVGRLAVSPSDSLCS